MNNRAPPRIFEPRRDGGLAALLGLTMIGAAATETVGLMLLAPMLTALGGDGGAAGGIATSLARLGLPTTPAPLLALFVALVFVRAAIVYARAMTGQRFEASLVDALRARAWSALLHCEWRKLASMQQSHNASLLISDIDRAGSGVNYAITAMATGVTLAGVALAGLVISPQIALVAALGGLLTIFAYRRMRRKAGELGKQLGEAYQRIYTGVAESLGALRVIKSFGREAASSEEYSANFVRLRTAERAYLRASGLSQMTLQVSGAVLLALVVWLALTRWEAGPATILPLVALFARALPLLGSLQTSWQGWAHSRPAVTAALTLITEAEAAREPDMPGTTPPSLLHAITFDQVTVRFAGREQAVLDQVSLTLPARRITVLTGPSGAGKSTLADLAGGLLAPDAGRVLIDDAALDGGLRRAWRMRVAYVQQDPVLFSGSIRDNLRWADPSADDETIQRVLSEASAQFVFALPQGLGTPVGESGRQLSGGERQRIVLARALLRAPDLLILDEATSALDAENEEAIAVAIAQLRDRMTVLVIGHRGSLQSIADHIIRLENGRIVSFEPTKSGKID